MSEDRKPEVMRRPPSNARRDFERQAGKARANSNDNDFSATVGGEIDLESGRASALERHDANWKRARDRLTHINPPAPSLGEDSGPKKSWKQQYEELRRQWETQRDAINENFDSEIDKARSSGQTLSRQFRADAAPQARDGQVKVPERSIAPAEKIAPETAFSTDLETAGVSPEPAERENDAPAQEPRENTRAASVQNSFTRTFNCGTGQQRGRSR